MSSVNSGEKMANTIRFGSSIGTCMTASSERAQLAEELDTKGINDPDKLIQCPFDKNHQIRSCRFPYHLIKCRKNHPELAKQLKTCPFNARHLVPKHELPHHTQTCEDRVVVDKEDGVNSNGRNRWHVPVSTWVNPNMSEDWDKEVDDSPTTFVWGETNTLHIKQGMRLTDNLGPGFRAPNTLPWS